MVKTNIWVLVMVMLVAVSSIGQITIVPNKTAQELAQMLSGTGVSVSNATLDCAPDANGTFTNVPNSILELTSGIILTTGKAKSGAGITGFDGSNTMLATNPNYINLTDPHLATMTSLPQKDMCRLIFNVVPQGDTLRMEYVFGSEEYPLNVCTNYSDVFGIFVSGPGLVGTANYAKVPGTNINVSINSVNAAGPSAGPLCTGLGPGSPFGSYFVTNTAGNYTYNGFVKKMDLQIPVIQGQSYTVKIAITDVIDSLADSGILLKEGSLTSKPIFEITGTSSNGSNTSRTLEAIEGCNPAQIQIKRPPNNNSLTLNTTLRGNAIHTVDYTLSHTSPFVIPAGTTSFTYSIQALTDQLVEPNDSVQIVFWSGNFRDSMTVYIRDYLPNYKVFNPTNDTTVCNGQSVQLYTSILPSEVTYEWIPSQYLSNPFISNPVFVAPAVAQNTTFPLTVRVSRPGCQPVDSTITINVEPGPIVSFAQNPINICPGDSAQISSFITPPGNYSYSWSPSTSLSQSNILSPIAYPTTSTTYTLTASSGSGCSGVGSVTVNPNPVRPDISNIIVQGTTCGQNNGSIQYVIPNPNSSYWISINNQAWEPTTALFNLPAGTHLIKFKNSIGCQFDTSIVVTQSSPPPNVYAIATNTTCGLSNGKVKLQIFGGTSPYQITWAGSSIIADSISNLSGGIYSYTVKDANNCIVQNTAIVAPSTQPNLILNATNASCGLNNGSITSSIQNAKAPFTFLWSTGQTTPSILNLNSGTYSLTMTDSLGCTSSASTSISNTLSIASSFSVVNTSCNQNNGKIFTTPIGGTPPFSYSWSNGSVSPNIDSLQAGKYTLTLTDANQCQYIDSAIVLPSSRPVAEATVSPPKCGLPNGSIKLSSILNGTPPFTYLWSTGATTDSIGLLSPSTYSVTVTDSLGCTTQLSRQINYSSNPKIEFTTSNASCGQINGRIFTKITQSVRPLSYSWSNGSSDSALLNINQGLYTLTITDSLGCTAIDSVSISATPALTLIASSTIATCNQSNGSLSLNILTHTGPYEVKWSDSSTGNVRTGLNPGDYTYFIEDSAKCKANGTVTIVGVSSPIVNLTTQHAYCDSSTGSIVSNVTGGQAPYSYLWSNGSTSSQILNVAHSTRYMLTVTDMNGCVTIVSDSILTSQSPTFSDTSYLYVCANRATSNSIDQSFIQLKNIVSHSPYKIIWNDRLSDTNKTKITNLSNTSETVTIIDQEGCKISKTYLITTTQPPLARDSIIKPQCSTLGAIYIVEMLEGTPGYSYEWERINRINKQVTKLPDTTPYLQNLPRDDYKVTVTDARGCVNEFEYQLRSRDMLYVKIDTLRTRCDSNTGVIQVTQLGGTAPYKVYWGDLDTNINPFKRDTLSDKEYYVRILDTVTQCEFDTLVAVELIYKYRLILDTLSISLCYDSVGYIKFSLSDTVPSPISIYWNDILDSSYQKGNLPSNNYKIQVIDSNKCKAEDLYSTIAPPVVKYSKSVTNNFCNQTTASIAIFPENQEAYEIYQPVAINWSNGSNNDTITHLNNGQYIVNITDKNNCIFRDTTTIINEQTRIINFKNIVQPTCGLRNGSFQIELIPNAVIDSVFIDGVYLAANSINGTPTFNNIKSGRSVVEVLDVTGCRQIDTIELNQSSAIELSAVVTPATCSYSNGSISITPSPVGQSYSYFWSNLKTTSQNAGLSSGLYSLNIKQTTGDKCEKDTTFEVPDFYAPISIKSSSPEICSKHNGSASVNVVDGFGPYTYTWSTGHSTPSISNVQAGLYYVTITDSLLCQKVDTFNIINTPNINATYTIKSASCDLNNGSILANVSGGLGALQYLWNNQTISPNNVNIDSGIYILTITDSVGCIKIDTITVSRLEKMKINIVKTDETCSENNGSISASITNNIGSYQYQWSSLNNNSLVHTNLNQGLYSLSVTDSSGCFAQSNVLINDLSGPTLSVTNSDATCGLSNGSIIVTVNGDNPPFAYYWDNIPSTTPIKNGINGGTFVFKAVDALGCKRIDTIVRPYVPNISGTFENIPPNCNQNNGKSKVKLSNGTEPYIYQWNIGSNTDSITNLSAGTYMVTVIDANNCQFNGTNTITNATPAIVSFDVTNESCGSSNGSIKVIINQGDTPFTYLWSTNETSREVYNKTVGQYQVTITDKWGCPNIYSISVGNSGIEYINSSITTPSCGLPNGSISAIPFGGTPPYIYQWSNGANQSTISNLPPGTYSVTISDATLCPKTQIFQLFDAPAPILTTSIVETPHCGINNGIITTNVVSSSPFLNYSWNYDPDNQTNMALNIDSGQYRLIVSDVNNCKDTLDVYLPRETDITVRDSIVKSICGLNNAAIYLTISGGSGTINKVWTNGSTDTFLKNVPSGIYNIQLTDQRGCVKNLSYNLLSEPKPVIQFQKLDPNCGLDNGQIRLFVQENTGKAPFNFVWNNGDTSTFVKDLGIGNYHISVTDGYGCQDSVVISLLIGQNPFSSISNTNVVCSDSNGTALFTVFRMIEPVQYQWSNGDTLAMATNLKPGKYFVLATDSRNCKLSDSITVTDQPGPIITRYDSISPFCLKNNGGIIVYDSLGTPPLRYQWSNGISSSQAINIPQGAYSVTITDLNNCVATKNFTLKDLPDSLRIDSIQTINPKCFRSSDGSLQIFPALGYPPYQYQLNNGALSNSSLFDSLNQNTYIAKVIDNRGCQRTMNIQLTHPTDIVIDTSYKVNLRCNNTPEGQLAVSASGGTPPYSYYWPQYNVSDSIVKNLLAGSHTVTVRDANQCLKSTSISLTEPRGIAIYDSTISNPKCKGDSNGSIQINVIGGVAPYSFLWDDTAYTEVYQNLRQGTYRVKVFDFNKCFQTYRFTLVDPPLVQFDTIIVDSINCFGSSSGRIKPIASGGQGTPYQFSISNPARYAFTSEFVNLDTGRYIVSVRDKFNCSTRDTVSLLLRKPISIKAFPHDTTITLGTELTIDFDITEGNLIDITSHHWEDNPSLECSYCRQTVAAPYTSTDYYLTVNYYDDPSCILYDTVRVKVVNPYDIHVPDIFSPNGDDANQFFLCYGNQIKQARLRIFNRIGEKLFETENGTIEGWDGTYKGVPQEAGSYIFVVDAVFLNKEKKTKSGQFMLLR